MNSPLAKNDLIAAHMSPPPGMAFYDSMASVHEDLGMLGYWSVIERAWNVMALDGVLCLDGRPILYLKESSQVFPEQDRVRLQRLIWNQGVANILVLVDPVAVYIYSGLSQPVQDRPEQVESEKALVETLRPVEYAQRLRSLHHELATGRYYEVHHNRFDPTQSVDSLLLDNLTVLRDKLVEGDDPLGIDEAHAFIGRVLFLCYLLDRRIVSLGEARPGRTGTSQFARTLDDMQADTRLDYLYNLFNELKYTFNGNMFDRDLEDEKKSIRPAHLEKLIQFLGGHMVATGQMAFWPYDFKMIPVETISAIYQDFLSKEDPENQRKRGAFYTPRFLAEMVVDIAMKNDPASLEWSFLDPACGSGIFLVILFNRIANYRLHNRHLDYCAKAELLKEILSKQIRGVDYEETACRIACFSLYLAYLDFFDLQDIQNYMETTGKPLPKLLKYGKESNGPEVDIPVVHNANYLTEAPLLGQKFDCVIGNPPWDGRGTRQLAQKFLEKSPESIRNGGIGCLLLPTKILQNKTDAFQAEWLRQVTLESVLQLADYRRVLFSGAKTPAMVARFKNNSPKLNHKIEFNAPKFNRDGLRQGVITISPSSRSWISLSDILLATKSKTAPVLWKRRLWGTPRDQKLIDMLETFPSLSDLAGSPKQGKRWVKGQGFQPNITGTSKSPKPPWWKTTDLYLSANAPCWDANCIQIYPFDCEPIGNRFSTLHRPRDRRLYQAPMVLVSQGFGKVAYCNFDVLFQDSLQSIAGPTEDARLLMFLAAYLRSNLAKFFLFHTAANWGSERDKVHLFELLRVPFPLPGDIIETEAANEIVNNIAHLIQELNSKLNELITSTLQSDLFSKKRSDLSPLIWERKFLVDQLQKHIEPFIYQYFDLTNQEIAIVEDTVRIFEPSSTPHSWLSDSVFTRDPVSKSRIEPYSIGGLKHYADMLTCTLNTWAHNEGSPYRISAEGGIDDRLGIATVSLHLSLEAKPFQKMPVMEGFADYLNRLHTLAAEKRGTLVYERDIFVFERERIHIVRPDKLINWTRTAALNDAAKIYGEIVLARRESNL